MSAPQFATLKAGYTALFNEMVINPEHADIVDAAARRCLDVMADPRIAEVSRRTGVPGIFIVLTMHEESDLSWGCHLHNGDPLTARTHNVPAGRPEHGEPPFDWVESAIDALQYENLDSITDWGVERVLFLEEGFNGWGYYLYHGINSPYLWSYSNLYKCGKYGSDDQYDPNLVSKQIGVAVLLKRMMQIDPSCSPAPARKTFTQAAKDNAHARNAFTGLIAAVVGGVYHGLHVVAHTVSQVVSGLPGVSDQVDNFMGPAGKLSHQVGIPWDNISYSVGFAFVLMAIAGLVFEERG